MCTHEQVVSKKCEYFKLYTDYKGEKTLMGEFEPTGEIWLVAEINIQRCPALHFFFFSPLLFLVKFCVEKVGNIWLNSALTKWALWSLMPYLNKNMDPKLIWKASVWQLFCAEENNCSFKKTQNRQKHQQIKSNKTKKAPKPVSLRKSRSR